MDTKKAKSILEMARGGFLERVDYEMPKIIENILDANTKATAKRKLTITMEFLPDEERTVIVADFTAKMALATTKPIRTMLQICGENSDGQMQVVEMTPQIPGQTALDDGEQEAPPMLKLIKFA